MLGKFIRMNQPQCCPGFVGLNLQLCPTVFGNKGSDDGRRPNLLNDKLGTFRGFGFRNSMFNQEANELADLIGGQSVDPSGKNASCQLNLIENPQM